jgi:hypothetical protein
LLNNNDDQKTIYGSLQSYKHLWIKKATGLGITEFMLSYMMWLCLKDNSNEKTGREAIGLSHN